MRRWITVTCCCLIPLNAANADQPKKEQVAMSAWVSCVLGYSKQFAKQAEPAETLVTAAFGSCLEESEKFRQAYKASTRRPTNLFQADADSVVDAVVEKVERTLHQGAVTQIIHERARN